MTLCWATWEIPPQSGCSAAFRGTIQLFGFCSGTVYAMNLPFPALLVGPCTPAHSHPNCPRAPFPNCQESKVMAKKGEEVFFFPSVKPHIINIRTVSKGGQSSSSQLVSGKCFLFFRPKCRDQCSVVCFPDSKTLILWGGKRLGRFKLGTFSPSKPAG